MRKFICMILCIMLLFAMTIPAFAEDTVTPPAGEGTSQGGGTQTGDGTPPEGGSQTGGGTPPEGGSQTGGGTPPEGGTQTGGGTPPEGGSQTGSGTPPEGGSHTHSYELVSDTATCGKAGVATYKCSCGDQFTKDTEATGKHTYGSWTKTEDGKHSRTCSGCGDVKKEAHSYGEWQDEESTDSHYRVCSICGDTQKGQHSWGSAVVIEKPTCKDEGIMGSYCSGCDFILVDEDPIPKLTTHTYDSACDPVCNVCEKEREIEHTFTKVWSKNYKGHWHECTKCGEQADFAKHIPGPAATEEKDQVCLTCGYVVTAKKEHTHTYEKEWSSDEAGHWHACTGKTCDTEQNYASHTFDDDCDPDCNVCGYERENSHTYEDAWQTSNFEHWNVCSVCGEESKHEKHVPGPEATDEAAQLCTVCEYELAPMLEHTHDFGTEYVQAQDSHWQECKCGELSVPEPHVWDEGKENRNDTTTYTCTVCGAEKTEEVPSSGFPWLIIILVLLALVCIGGIVALVIILKRGGFDEEDELDEEPEDDAEEDEEEKLINDYFSSLDRDGYK